MKFNAMITIAVMATAAVWSFAAESSGAAVSPIAATVPGDEAAEVPRDQGLAVTFWEAMNPATINTSTFVLQQRGLPVFGMVTYDGTTASFTPAVSLAPRTRYTATLTAGIMSSAGAFLAAPRSWNFTTGPQVVLSPQLPVDLGSCQNFLLLAYSTITNTSINTHLTGNIGLSPAAGTYMTGILQANVTGTIYTVDGLGPAGNTKDPVRLTRARNDLTSAYNDAAGRVTPNVIYGVAANIGGLTLPPGLYKFNSSAAITGSNLTLSGPASGVWIFQIASTLTVGNGIRVILAGGATAANIFWQVSTSATLGTTSHMEGTLMANASIAFQTLSSLNGRALVRTAAITLDSFTGVLPCAQPAPILNSLRARKNSGNINLTWAASTDSAFNHYNIYSKLTAAAYPGGWEKLSQTTLPTYSEPLTSLKGYYLVSVVNNSGCESSAE